MPVACMMDIRAKIGARMKELRHALGLTQEALAHEAEVDKTYLNEVENGKRNVSVVNLEKIILALQVNVSQFFDHELFQKKGK